MGHYKFKSSGTTQQTQTKTQLTVTPPVIGILTPLSLGTTDLLTTSTNLAVQVADNFRNLLQTNWGERLGLYDFGANLRPLLVDRNADDDFDSAAQTRIKNAVQRWMPYIVLQTFQSNFIKVGKLTHGLAQVQIVITYDIPSLNVTGQKIAVTLYAM